MRGETMCEKLIGKTVQFYDRERGFARYGVVKRAGRVRDEPRVTKRGKRVKRPTVDGFEIEIPGGRVLRVRQGDVRLVRRYGEDIRCEDYIGK